MRIETSGYTLINADWRDVRDEIEIADHIITDPPYEDTMHMAKKGGRKLRRDKGNELVGLDFASIAAIRAETCTLLSTHSTGWCILFCTPEGVAAWRDGIEAVGIRYKRACVWVKPDASPQFNGQGPAMGAEMFVTAWAGKGFSRWNGGGKRGVYTHLTNARSRHGMHPTEKPLALMSEIIADFTMREDTILDPFMGTGSCGVAAIKLGRRFIGIEKDPRYFEAACERIAAAQTDDLFLQPTQVGLF